MFLYTCEKDFDKCAQYKLLTNCYASVKQFATSCIHHRVICIPTSN